MSICLAVQKQFLLNQANIIAPLKSPHVQPLPSSTDTLTGTFPCGTERAVLVLSPVNQIKTQCHFTICICICLVLQIFGRSFIWIVVCRTSEPAFCQDIFYTIWRRKQANTLPKQWCPFVDAAEIHCPVCCLWIVWDIKSGSSIRKSEMRTHHC